tara:strand:- start:1488 stop:1883 length:396 start_codon:yes stop_codon:yes gene_type:complete
MKFKLLCGGHSEAGKDFTTNDVVTSEINLEQVFGSNKFQTVEGSCGTEKCKEDCTEEIIEQQEEQVEVEVEKSVEGKNVSDDFSSLEEYVSDGLQVLKRKRKYFIRLNGVDLNSEPLLKKEVESFVVDYFG